MIIRRLEVLFGFKIDTNQFKQATSAVDRFADNANRAMGVLAGHFAISTIKAVIKGTIKGVDLHCEKSLNLGRGKWEVMCKASDEIDTDSLIFVVQG